MNQNGISMKQISGIIWKNIVTICVITILFGIGGMLYAKHKQVTTYESVRNVMINRSYDGADANEKVQADINLGKTYAKIIESKDVAVLARHSLPKNLKKEYSATQIASMVNADPLMQTTVIKVSVKSKDPKSSVAIVNAVTNAAAKKLPEKAGSPVKLSLFSKATVDEAESHTSPSTKKVTLVGAAVGFLLGMLIAFSVTTWKHLIK